jgi:glycosyltransferase involved in cell wall biosynthesis
MDATIAIATFGAQEWLDRALNETIPAAREHGVPVVHAHGRTLGEARNAALAEARTPWVIHLDADDSLEPGYIDAMGRGRADVRAPVVRYIHRGRPRPLWQPRVAGHTHDCEASCLRDGNWVVIGACVRTELLRSVGWHDFDWSEDWATWALLAKAGASFELVRDAIYRAEMRPESRNRGAARATRLEAHRVIELFVWPEEVAA